MNGNSFEIYASNDNLKKFIESSIESSQAVIDHYTFVIEDISSVISDAALEATKGPTIDFLVQMRAKWLEYKNELEIYQKTQERD